MSLGLSSTATKTAWEETEEQEIWNNSMSCKAFSFAIEAEDELNLNDYRTKSANQSDLIFGIKAPHRMASNQTLMNMLDLSPEPNYEQS